MTAPHDIPAPDLDVIQSLLDQGRLKDVEDYCKQLRKLLEMRIEDDPNRYRLAKSGLPLFGVLRGGVRFNQPHPTDPDRLLTAEGGITAPIEGATLQTVTPLPAEGEVITMNPLPDGIAGEPDPHEASNFPLEESICIHCHHPIEMMDGGWRHRHGLVVCVGTGRHPVESWMTATPPDRGES
jgi:hypothetical protein